MQTMWSAFSAPPMMLLILKKKHTFAYFNISKIGECPKVDGMHRWLVYTLQLVVLFSFLGMSGGLKNKTSERASQFGEDLKDCVSSLWPRSQSDLLWSQKGVVTDHEHGGQTGLNGNATPLHCFCNPDLVKSSAFLSLKWEWPPPQGWQYSVKYCGAPGPQ